MLGIDLALGAVAFVASFFATALVRAAAWRYGWIIPPRSDRWHRFPTASHGGLGFGSVFIVMAVVIVARHWTEGRGVGAGFVPSEWTLSGTLVAGALVLMVFGLFDDLRHFRPATKLVCELVVASGFILAGGILSVSGVRVIDLLISYFWLIGITNAVNMLDNMDGLAAGVVIIGTVTLIVLAVPAAGGASERVLAVPLGAAFVGAVLGFLFHNLPPASIFMGDSGSLPTGFALAALTVPSALNGFLGIESHGSIYGPLLVVLIPATVLAIPIFDTTLVTTTRKWRAQRASQGGRDHASHRLVGLGLSERRTLTVLYALAVLGGSLAVMMKRFPGESVPLFGAFVIVLALTGVYLGQVKLVSVEPARIPPGWTPLVSNILYKRHAAAVLSDVTLVVLCFYAAQVLQLGGAPPGLALKTLVDSLPVVVAACISVFFLAGLYRGQWRLIAVADLPRYAVAILGGAAVAFVALRLAALVDPAIAAGHFKVTFVMFAALLLPAITSSRLSFRLLDTLLGNSNARWADGSAKPVLIYGAGRAGKLLYEEVMFNPTFKDFAVVGFVDDDPQLAGRKLCSVPIRTPAEWSGKTWHIRPDVWISSRRVPDARAREFAILCGSGTALRRMTLTLDRVD